MITLLLMVLCIACYIGQNFFNQLYSTNYKGDSRLVSYSFNTIYGVVVGFVAFSICNGFSFNPSSTTWVFGLFEGVALFLYNIGFTKAALTGPYAFKSIMSISGNIVTALVISAFFWKDEIGVIRIAAVFLMIAAFFVMNKNGLDFSTAKKGYFFWIILVFLANGTYGVIMDAHQRVMLWTEKNELIIITFFSSALMSFLYLLIRYRKSFLDSFRMGKKSFLFSIISSLSAAFAVYLIMILLEKVPVTILYSTLNGLILTGNICLGAIILRERLNKNAIIGIVMITTSIVMFSL